jgi:tetratricopeptide (TPR) repeat protein
MMLGYAAAHFSPFKGLQIAQKFIQNLRKQNKVDWRDHRSILTLYLRAKQYDDIVHYFDQIRYRYQTKPNVVSYNYLMAAHLESKRYQEVLSTWQDCVSAWPESRYENQDGWAFVIEAQGRMGNIMQVLDLYQHLGKHAEPQSQVYQAQIRALGYCKRIMDAMHLFLEHSDKDYLLFYDAIIEAAIASGHKHAPLMFWTQLLDHCDRLDIQEGIGIEPRDSICFIKEKDKKNRNTPLPITITRMMEYFASNQDYNDCLETFYYYFPHFQFDKEAFELATRVSFDMGLKDDAQYILYCMSKLEYPADMELKAKIKSYRRSKSTRNKEKV